LNPAFAPAKNAADAALWGPIIKEGPKAAPREIIADHSGAKIEEIFPVICSSFPCYVEIVPC
jgi:hypothetical protein